MQASNELVPKMVNLLLTSFIRVNIPSSAESNFAGTGVCYEEGRANEVELLELAPRLWHRRRWYAGLIRTAVS
jgi:hypothetical protein